MAEIIKVLGIVLFFGLITKGNSQCSVSNLSVSQSRTGATVQNKPEWAVTITNNCPCFQSDVTLDCKGFTTVESIDPSILSFTGSGNTCLVYDGQSISSSNHFNFKYAWDTSFPLTPISSHIACS